jgi:hypothetical protein
MKKQEDRIDELIKGALIIEEVKFYYEQGEQSILGK